MPVTPTLHRYYVTPYIDIMQTATQNVTKMFTNVKIVEFHYHIWINFKKCIQISANMLNDGYWFKVILDLKEYYEMKPALYQDFSPHMLICLRKCISNHETQVLK